MFKHMLVSTATKEYRHRTTVSYSISCNQLILKLHDGRLTTLELIDLIAVVVRREPEARQAALQWSPLNQERGTYTRSGFSGRCDYYIVFKDDTTGYITRRKVIHETMSGYIEPKDNIISLFLPDFLLLGLNNELVITSDFFINILKWKLKDNIYITKGDDEDRKTTVEITEITNQEDKYKTEYVGSLSTYLESIAQPAGEVEEACEVVGE